MDAKVDSWVFEQELKDKETLSKSQTVKLPEEEAPSVTVMDIVRVPSLRANLFVVNLVFIVTITINYIMVFYAKYFPGDLFQNNLYYACSDFIAFSTVGLMLENNSIANSYKAGSLVSIVGALIYLSMPMSPEMIPVVICLTKLGMTILYNTTVIGL